MPSLARDTALFRRIDKISVFQRALALIKRCKRCFHENTINNKPTINELDEKRRAMRVINFGGKLDVHFGRGSEG